MRVSASCSGFGPWGGVTAVPAPDPGPITQSRETPGVPPESPGAPPETPCAPPEAPGVPPESPCVPPETTGVPPEIPCAPPEAAGVPPESRCGPPVSRDADGPARNAARGLGGNRAAEHGNGVCVRIDTHSAIRQHHEPRRGRAQPRISSCDAWPELPGWSDPAWAARRYCRTTADSMAFSSSSVSPGPAPTFRLMIMPLGSTMTIVGMPLTW